jgi:Na+/H+ antiporter NhaC
MRGRTRLFLCLLFVALFVAVPSPDATSGRPYMVLLRVREWLLAADGPLQPWAQAGTLPPLAVQLLQSPPIVDDGERAQREAEYARLAEEWCAARTADGQPARVDRSRPAVPMLVRTGDRGFQVELAAPDGGVAKVVLPYATRWSLLPALIAITLAVLLQRVLWALLAAGLVGGIVHVATVQPGVVVGAVDAVTGGVWHFAADALWRRAICHDFYLRITVFVVFLFMTVGVITRNGGVQGMVLRLQTLVRGPVSAQLCSFLAGILVFFDDYTNCLLVGTTMRPLCDHRRVSRAKLAYIVDSTAAPIAGLSVFSTWVVYEMSMYRAPLALVTRQDGTPYVSGDAFEVFLATMPFRCYCLFALLLVPMVALLRRDFGPMLAAERRARLHGELLAPDAVPMVATDAAHATPPPGVPLRARNAVLPLLVLVLGTVATMVLFGLDDAMALPAGSDLATQVRTVLANAQSDWALLGASAAAWLTAVTLSLGQRLLTVRQLLATSLAATRTLYLAFGILFLAWTLGHVCNDLGTSFFLTASARGAMQAELLPLLLFFVAGAMAFATGTSFGTMAILLPNVVVLAHRLGTDAAFTGSAAAGGPALMLLCIGAVLEGAIFGDHCSPISDTTVLSSLGSQCDLIGHVTTQLPYSLLAMVTAAVCGYLPLAVFGPHCWPWCLAGGAAVMAAFLLLFGRDPARPPPNANDSAAPTPAR